GKRKIKVEYSYSTEHPRLSQRNSLPLRSRTSQPLRTRRGEYRKQKESQVD
ncbi:hypothetical protein DBR06_SOUSAS4310031, partial [Sousa chinensis]